MPRVNYADKGPPRDGGDGPTSEAMRLARKLRGQGARESWAAEKAAEAFNVDAREVARALGFRGALEDFDHRDRLARYAAKRAETNDEA